MLKDVFSPSRASAFLLCSLLLTPAVQAQSNAAAKRAAAKSRVEPVMVASAPAPAAKEGNGVSSGTRCGDEEALPGAAGAPGAFEASTADPRGQLQELVAMAQQRSQSLGAITLLAQAARDDWEEARAARLPIINLGGGLSHVGTKTEGLPVQQGVQGRASLNVSAPLYDSGRIEQLAAWRSQLAEAARQGLINAEQQLALQTVSLAMDRSRYQLQVQVYGQYVRKMACLVEALETIVRADRGRSSELVQATKNRQQAELAVEQTFTALRQTEIRLRRFVGDQLPPSASYSALLTQVPELGQMQADVLQAAEVAQLSAQAKAQSSYAESVAAGHKPQLSWQVGTTAITGPNRGGDWVAGVTLNIPLYNPGADHSISAARRRAEAARLQREDAIESRRYRVADMHEVAVSSFDRARRIVEILRNSDRVRAATLQQWQQLGRRSLFDVMGSEADYYSLRVAHVNALFDGQQAVALLWSMGRGVLTPLR
ncbi:TolC family protein [Roseateles sp. DAIF2]|uniref:TolC family protein n=1 Tax=Roseateles sp. DAIF2 TaxID=2714952 RepID=UPI0018A3200D|nr:TolC family protein [Roseateles sp. DAIF2]QPF73761.1 TolC family protein [Roseateles sp. DAIF2]